MNKNLLIAKLLFKEAVGDGSYYNDPESIEARRTTPEFQAAQARWNAVYKGPKPQGDIHVRFEYAAPNRPYMSDSPALNRLATSESARADRQATANGTMSVAEQTRRMAPQGRAAQYYAKPEQVAAVQPHQAGPASKDYDYQVVQGPRQGLSSTGLTPAQWEAERQKRYDLVKNQTNTADTAAYVARQQARQAAWKAKMDASRKTLLAAGVQNRMPAIERARAEDKAYYANATPVANASSFTSYTQANPTAAQIQSFINAPLNQEQKRQALIAELRRKYGYSQALATQLANYAGNS